jgi:hypothetical protein
MPPRLLLRATFRAACLAGAALLILAGAAHAQDEDDDDDDGPDRGAIVVQIDGPCLLTVEGRVQACHGVAYMAFPSTHRIDFTALTGETGWAFSGEDDVDDDAGYILAVDSVLDPSAEREQADGQCRMTVSADHRTVTSLQCRASTHDGVVILKASGTATADDEDEDDGADDGWDDDGPDQIQA